MSALLQSSFVGVPVLRGRGRRPAISHPQRERAHVRPVVLQAARELFRETPSVAITMEHISARAGVTRHTLGNHFSSKDEIFRVSRETMIDALSQVISDEIPTDLDAFDGIYQFIQLCCRIFMDERNREIKFSLLHERTRHNWLSDAYHRQIILKLVKICETYLLYKSLRKVPALEQPRLVAEQSVMFAASLADEHLRAPEATKFCGRLVEQHIETAAKAYSALFQSMQSSTSLPPRESAD